MPENVDIIQYDRVVFKNDQTPLNAENLNQLSDHLSQVIDNTNILTDKVSDVYNQINIEKDAREQADEDIIEDYTAQIADIAATQIGITNRVVNSEKLKVSGTSNLYFNILDSLADAYVGADIAISFDVEGTVSSAGKAKVNVVGTCDTGEETPLEIIEAKDAESEEEFASNATVKTRLRAITKILEARPLDSETNEPIDLYITFTNVTFTGSITISNSLPCDLCILIMKPCFILLKSFGNVFYGERTNAEKTVREIIPHYNIFEFLL